MISINVILAVFISVTTCIGAAPLTTMWWGDLDEHENSSRWHYRIPLTVIKDKKCDDIDYSNMLFKTRIDFTQWFHCPNIDINSLRIIKDGDIEIPSVSGMWEDAGWEKYNVSCNLSFIIPNGDLRKENSKRYFLYFDRIFNRKKQIANYSTDLKIKKNLVENSVYKLCIEPKRGMGVAKLIDKETGEELLSIKTISHEKSKLKKDFRLLSTGFSHVNPVKTIYERMYLIEEFKVKEEYTFYHNTKYFQLKYELISLCSQDKKNEVLPQLILECSKLAEKSISGDCWWQGIFKEGTHLSVFCSSNIRLIKQGGRIIKLKPPSLKQKTDFMSEFSIYISLEKEKPDILLRKHSNPLKVLFGKLETYPE